MSEQQPKGNRRRQCSAPFMFTAILVFLPLFSFPLQRQSDAVTAIRGGTILTMTGRTIHNGAVLIRGKKIEAVGGQEIIPATAVIVDASGKYVMPGIIDAMSYYGIRPFSLNDTAKIATPENKIIQAYYPFGEFKTGKGGITKDVGILSSGITTVYIAPGNRQVIGGQGAVVKVYGEDYESLILREPAAMDITIGGNSTNVNRLKTAALLRQMLISTREFGESRMDPEKHSAGDEIKIGKARHDPALEAMSKLLSNKIPARIEANYPEDILTAVRLAEEFGLDLIFDGGMGAYQVKHKLAEGKYPVVLSPLARNPFTSGEGNSEPEWLSLANERNAVELYEAGVKIVIAGFGTNPVGGGKTLLMEAGAAASSGLPEAEALKAITLNAAEILGVSDRIGSLQKGKDADILILNGAPLNVVSSVEQVYIDGTLVFDRSNQ